MSYRQNTRTSADDYFEYRFEERIKRLEDKVFKDVKRKQATKSQKLLLLKELGLLEKIDELKLSQNKRALLISTLIDADEDNVRKDLSQVHLKNSELNNSSNINFLLDLYEEVGLKEHARLAEKKFLEIQKVKEIISKKK